MFNFRTKLSSVNVNYLRFSGTITGNHYNQLYHISIEKELSYNLFRIIQEFVNNTLKHAQASSLICIIDWEPENSQLLLKLSDNGIGFDAKNHQFGLGMTNIYNRAKLFNLNLNLTSKKKKGTSMNMKIPI